MLGMHVVRQRKVSSRTIGLEKIMATVINPVVIYVFFFP